MNIERKKRQTVELGYDSFLDIVANLVGILIILVVVLGAQSSTRIEEIKQQTDAINASRTASPDLIERLNDQARRSSAAQQDSDRLEQLIVKQQQIVNQRVRERDLLLDLLNQAEATWKEAKTSFDDKRVANAERLTDYREELDRIAQLEREIERLSNQPQTITELQHLPTPMAKTVFGDEIHFRLKGNNLSVVPVEQLLAEIKNNFERISYGSKEDIQESAVGPLRGYIARYELEKTKGTINRGGQIQTATRIQLVNLSIEPLQEPYGTPFDHISKPGELLDVELAGRDPASTTITVWVYPDSFQAFRSLKEILYQRGFATAARPLPMEHVISGGPDGTRSQAQ